ncbi:MAG: M14 family metallopeptidase [Oscillospiraceae bacterium]|nr:M14 family metallopeptidase [Oscillospiraceae bacterium]
MKETWQIAGFSVAPGERMDRYVPVEHTDEVMPVTLLNGTRAGKTVLMTSGIHGGEYEGISAAIELARELDPKEISGQLAIIHPCSVQTFQAKQENITPEDGKNLNRVFPPDQNGTLTDKIAWTLWNQFQRYADFHIDLHGCFSDWITPHVYYTGVAEPEVIAIAKAAAEVVSVPYMVKSVATSGCYNHSGISGIPGILLERGESNLFSENEVQRYKRDVRNVLRHLGVLHSEMEPHPIQPVDVCDLIYAHSKIDQKGCWYPAIDLHKPFRKGEKLGEVRDFFGNVLDTTYAEQDGVGLYMYGMMPIDEHGFEICYAKIGKAKE